MHLLTLFEFKRCFRKTTLVSLLISISFSSHSQNCSNNWLYLQGNRAKVTIGDLDITGDKLTIEATINRTQAFDPAFWNVAGTKDELRLYQNTALPKLGIQTGLLAYYTFNNFINKQRNTAWDSKLTGSGYVPSSNATCADFIEDPPGKATTPNPVVTVGFTIPDTVCINTPVTIKNTTTGGTNFYWNFCDADVNAVPEAVNMGNTGGVLSLPVFMDLAQDNNGNYYGFSVNNYPGRLIRLNFGNSFLNNPTTTDLGNFNGVISNNAEGIQIVEDQGKWYALIVEGYPAGGTPSKIVKLTFGTDIANISPVATDWGNIGNLNYPIDLHVFEENNNWYGFTVNALNNTITRFNFGNSFENTPNAINLGNFNSLNYPNGIFAINENGNWHVFITNGVDNGTITRLDFGNSLLNNPVAVNLGNPGNTLDRPRDLYIIKFCGETVGFVVNGGDNANNLVKLTFKNGLAGIPDGNVLGNIGGFDLPHSFTKLFRIGTDLFSFITNARNNTITRLRFAGCTNASIPNSSDSIPPIVLLVTFVMKL